VQEHPLIELYVTISDERQNASVQKLLESVNLDEVVQQTLQLADITQKVMMTLLVTDDEGIREMNQQYRQQDKPTDVLSFPLLSAPLVNAPAELLWPPIEDPQGTEFVTPSSDITNLGDVVMSWPIIERQAAEAGHSSVHELLYLLSHGVLHLIGYDDQTEAGYQTMVRMQQTVLHSLNQ
jgi:probable rRNA maturation factor